MDTTQKKKQIVDDANYSTLFVYYNRLFVLGWSKSFIAGVSWC